MASVTAGNTQSAYDLALQTTGTLDNVVALMDSNNISSVNYDFVGGETIEFEDPTTSEGQFYQTRGYVFVTGEPEAQSFGDYNNDYSVDFNI